jgi:hypothetical protein
LLAVVGLLAASLLGADASTDAARSELARERRLLAADAIRLADLTHRLEAALSDLAGASHAVAEAVGRSESVDEVSRREDALASVEQDVRSLLDRRRLLSERVVDRRRHVALLELEIQAKRPGDVLNGRWTVVVDPGEQRGVFRLSLQGTIVSGEYQLEGGYSGSLRGTLVSDRVRLESVDSKLGFNAIYYGRLSPDGRELSGTWEATNLGGTGDVGGGRWKASREEEKEESP